MRRAADLRFDDLGRFLSTTGRLRARRPSFSTGPVSGRDENRKLMAVAGATGLLLAVALTRAAVFQYTVWLRRHGEDLETEVARANRNAEHRQPAAPTTG